MSDKGNIMAYEVRKTYYDEEKNQIKSEETFVDGERHGLDTWWYKDGTVKSQAYFLHGEKFIKEDFVDNCLRRIAFRED